MGFAKVNTNPRYKYTNLLVTAGPIPPGVVEQNAVDVIANYYGDRAERIVASIEDGNDDSIVPYRHVHIGIKFRKEQAFGVRVIERVKAICQPDDKGRKVNCDVRYVPNDGKNTKGEEIVDKYLTDPTKFKEVGNMIEYRPPKESLYQKRMRQHPDMFAAAERRLHAQIHKKRKLPEISDASYRHLPNKSGTMVLWRIVDNRLLPF